MLTLEAIDSAMALTSLLDSKGLFLMPTEGTPLGELVRDTRSDSNTMVGRNADGVWIDTNAILHMANAKDPVLQASAHDKTMDSVTELCIRSITSHMVFARTVVAPAVTALVEKSAAMLKGMNPSSIMGMDVQLCNPPAPLQLAAFEKLVKKFADMAIDPPMMVLSLPLLSSKEIIDLMHTGSAAVDAAIDEWAQDKGDAWLQAMWADVFQIHPVAMGKTAAGFASYTEHKSEGVDYAIAIFLVCRKLVESGPMPGVAMGLPAFEKTVVEFRNQAGARICRALAEQDMIDKSGQLVRKVEGGVSHVNERVYRTWIENGGDNDVLFGNTLRKQPLTTTGAINESAPELRKLWQSHASLQATIESNRRFQRTKEVLHKVFFEELRGITEGDEAVEGNRQMIMKLFEEQLAATREEELGDLWALCLRLVCKSRFFRSDADVILRGIERARKQNPSLSVREAATVSMIEYIASWVAGQFTVHQRG